ncbi:high affinity immunoglobulin epsilon receptor subunit gamma [Cricetulus griseus]|uniref:high affinity immunoglobulin epsilon receptor subunit gamma n=1 Tax=Cricetulus griseus TaxID=10029 RepID=UPI00045449A9|nr:high affinity immunoglobulin epsilon receptor subunit gamma [Cricetulus griseus]XP_035314578.1 high affinity immunoglobulin epsilon receptor subunit gamma [Cricetulus griseus]
MVFLPLEGPSRSRSPSHLPDPFPFPVHRATLPCPVHRVPWVPCIPSAALGEPQLCYILDAILFLYGIVLTLLYCRLKIQVRKAAIASYEKSDAVYTGLSTRNQETYETLKHEKPPQ